MQVMQLKQLDMVDENVECVVEVKMIIPMLRQLYHYIHDTIMLMQLNLRNGTEMLQVFIER